MLSTYVWIRKISISTILFLFCFCTVIQGKEISVPRRIGDGKIIFEFDENIISEKILKKYVVIRPGNCKPDYYLAKQLELCSENDSTYYPCGNRSITAENFFKNAEINLKISKNNLKYLQELNYIEELKPVVDYYKNSLTFDIWRKETLLFFYKSWDINVLKKNYMGINPLKIIPDILLEIEHTNSNIKKYKIAKFKWGNAVNHRFRKKLGNPPYDIWKTFLKKYNIKETVFEKKVY